MRHALLLALAVVAMTAAPAHGDAVPSRVTCYPAQFSAFLPQRLTAVDQLTLTSRTFSVDLPERVCTPAAVEAEVLSPGPPSLTCYTVRATPFAPRDVRLRDDFGTATLRILQAAAVCMPTGGGDSYTCFAVQPSPRQSGVSLTVADAYGRAKESLGFTTRVCASNGVARRPFLTCYGIASGIKGSTVVVRNDFGVLRAALGPRDQLCTSALRA